MRSDASVPVMSTYHRLVVEGAPLELALAAASLLEPLMPPVCFGAS